MTHSKMTTLLICPGIHPPHLTQEFLQGLGEVSSLISMGFDRVLVFPTQQYPAYSAIHILQFLEDCCLDRDPIPKLVIISFSAGVVGAIGAAWGWRLQGRTVNASIAIDGWGVPLIGDFPLYRLSHDRFTHWSSSLLGSGWESFCADPAVSHLDLWRHPDRVEGWQMGDLACYPRLTATEFIKKILQRHR